MLPDVLNDAHGLHKHTSVPTESKAHWGGAGDGDLWALLDGEGRFPTSVGVIDHGVEGLVDPLPEQHGRRRPETERPRHAPTSPATPAAVQARGEMDGTRGHGACVAGQVCVCPACQSPHSVAMGDAKLGR